ncbi:MAG TPA: hypothetical protein PK733_05825 [Clostridiales bacterium]|mgnify:CR=1 FL=1|nr:hypothetical protein [Clostridiales bacterium]
MNRRRCIGAANVALIIGIAGIVLIFTSIVGVLLAGSLMEQKKSNGKADEVANIIEETDSLTSNQSNEKPSGTSKGTSKGTSDSLPDSSSNNPSGNFLDSLSDYYPNYPQNRQELTEKLEEYKKANKDLVVYQGPVRHIFFHPLIAFPELAFDGDYISQGFDDWFITVKEFNKILESLYNKNYILIDIKYMYEESEEVGKKLIPRRDMLLPPGKKPLIISIDDMNYYKYMRQNGVVHKLILDSEGNISDFSITPSGNELITKENDIVTILDRFVMEHPDFSFMGAKGIAALTGYEGILGYRTDNPPAPNIEEEKKEALKIIKRLKETGWSFACHGYGHLDTVKIGLDVLKKDTQRWKDEVEPLIGPTPVYIFPFGSGVLPGSEKSNYLKEAGFPVMCAVGNGDYIKYESDVIYMDRIHIDGIAFRDRMPVLKEMFEIDDIVDEVRPWKNQPNEAPDTQTPGADAPQDI